MSSLIWLEAIANPSLTAPSPCCLNLISRHSDRKLRVNLGLNALQ
ncbi:hypothetical protein [Nostoc sp. FACHB-133]|nr:hypothetical protein [Nostoc sp. FACHB-133]